LLIFIILINLSHQNFTSQNGYEPRVPKLPHKNHVQSVKVNDFNDVKIIWFDWCT